MRNSIFMWLAAMAFTSAKMAALAQRQVSGVSYSGTVNLCSIASAYIRANIRYSFLDLLNRQQWGHLQRLNGYRKSFSTAKGLCQVSGDLVAGWTLGCVVSCASPDGHVNIISCCKRAAILEAYPITCLGW
jgi:hypothetical protein